MRYSLGARWSRCLLLVGPVSLAGLLLAWSLSFGGSSSVAPSAPRLPTNDLFPDQPRLVVDRSLPSDLYHQFKTPLPHTRRAPEDAVLPVPIVERRCLDRWIARGVLEEGCRVDGNSQVEFVWTWVNGSDPRWSAHNKRFSTPREIGNRQAPPARHYRGHGELEHSLRSVAGSMGSAAGGFWLVVGDWEEDGRRVGQLPSWLTKDGGGKISVVHHSQVWQDHTDYARLPEPGRWEERRRTLNASLPTFNSFAIEANMFNLVLPSPAHVQMQDDFFLVAPHAPSDFYSALYGPVLPLSVSESESRPLTDKAMRPDPDRWNLWRLEQGLAGANPNGVLSCDHEWEALERSNWLLSQRFGLKPRPNSLHIPKPLLLPLLDEVATIWGSSYFERSVQRRFREDARRRPGDLHAIWLGQALLLERSREALLWTWLVARLGDGAETQGLLGDKEQRELRAFWIIDEREKDLRDAQKSVPYTLLEKVLGRKPATLEELVVPQTTSDHRQTLQTDRVLASFDRLSEPSPKANVYGWSSFDGPAPPYGSTLRNCSINLKECFGTFWTSRSPKTPSVDLFKWVAFERPYCGDCILSALLQGSGPVGLEALLPPPDRLVRFDPLAQPLPRHQRGGQAHLPLTADFKATDFSIEAVIGSGKWGSELNLRAWCEELIARYTWTVLANSTARFTMVRGAASVEEVTAHVASPAPPSVLGLNDDIPVGFSAEIIRKAQEASDKLTSFLERQWPVKADWER